MKKFITKRLQTHAIIFLSIAHLLSRVVNLTKLPIFNDEAIYLDWGWKSLHTNAGLFYSLYDAKSPFLIWIFGIFESLIRTPLFMGRFVSVLAGLLTLIGIYKVAKSLCNEKVALLSSVFYIVIPLFAFFDRQALMESSLTATGIWSFYFLLQTFESKKIKYPIFLGLILGIGIFIKLSGLIFLVSSTIILLYRKFFKETTIVIGSTLLALSPLLFQPTFWASFNSNNRFMLSPTEILGFPFSLWIKNISDTLNVSFFHLTPLVFALLVYGIYLFFRKKKLIAPIFFLTNIFFVLIISKSLNPRYLTTFLVLVSIFSSYAILSFKKNASSIIGITAFLLPAIITTLLIFSPLAYFNLLDRFTTFSQKSGYVTDWTSGYGIPETVNYLNDQRNGKNVIVATRLDAGNPESSMFTYFNGVTGVKVVYLDPKLYGPEFLKLNCLPSQFPIYFVARDNSLNGLDKFFTEAKRFNKPEGDRYISVHVLKKCG